MGILSSIKAKMFGSGESTDIPVERVNDYRDVQDNEIRNEGRVGIIPHDEGKLKPVDTDVREKYYTEKAIAKRKAEKKEVARAPTRDLREVERPSFLSRAYSGYQEKVRRYNEGQLAKQSETKHERKLRERREKDEEKMVGMSEPEREKYKETLEKRRVRDASEKAREDTPYETTAREKRALKLQEKQAKLEAKAEFEKSRAREAGKHAGKPVASPFAPQKEKKGKKGEGQSPANRPASSIGNPAFTQGSERLIPHGFMPQGGYAPGFNDYQGGMNSPGFEPPRMMRPVGFEAPQAQPEPQPERRMTRREMQRQQAREDIQKWKQEQQQQFMQEQGIGVPLSYFTAPPQPSRGRTQSQQPQGNRPQPPQFINVFEGYKPEHTNKKGSNGQSMPRMVNLFERDDAPSNTKIGKHEPHALSSLSAELLGINVGIHKDKKNRQKAPWEQ